MSCSRSWVTFLLPVPVLCLWPLRVVRAVLVRGPGAGFDCNSGGREKDKAAKDKGSEEQGGSGEPADDSHCRGAQLPQADERVPRRPLLPHAARLRAGGGAIDFVKELEQLLPPLEAHKRSRERAAADIDGDDAAPFADFFTFPQYSMRMAAAPETATTDDTTTHREGATAEPEETSGSRPSAVADVEATMVESHANLRVLSRRRPWQLLRLVVGLQGHRLTVLHLNMSSAGHMVLYSFSLKGMSGRDLL